VTPPSLLVELSAVIVAVRGDAPQVLVVRGDPRFLDALPSGPFDALEDRTLEVALRRWVAEQTQLELGYVEQLYTFGDRYRTEREREGGPRTISIGYLALTRFPKLLPAPLSAWGDWYEYFPWEDRRAGAPAMLARSILPALEAWIETAADDRDARRERFNAAFGSAAAGWDDELALPRYELLYEAGLVAEAGAGEGFGRPMDGDHRRILATAIGRLRGKIKYRPVVFELLAPSFTLLELQRNVEALAGLRLHTANFRRLIENGRLVEATGRFRTSSRGRPAEEFRFRREVALERPAPGVLQPSRGRAR
jgi:hypothetical protein